jgi:hypothetical protein
MLVSRGHTLARFAGAIDLAFARWDLSHLHLFRFEAGRTAMPDGDGWDDDALDSTATRIGSIGLKAGDSFGYVFDLGDEWTHDCAVERDDVDPDEEFGGAPTGPVPIWGWGMIPDQYGRKGPDA